MRLFKFLDHTWRLFATAFSFTVFGIGGLVMGLLIFPLMFVFLRDRQSRMFRARCLIGRAVGGYWNMLSVLGVIDYRITGREHIDVQRSQLVVANHPTLIDVVILISLFPRANCVIKEAVTKNFFMRSVVRAADYISNSDPEDLLDSCVAYLQTGGSLMLFPEGTRTTPGQKIDFKPGAATVATRAEVDALPVVIACKPLFLLKELPWYYVPDERPQFTISILAPIHAREVEDGESGERQTRVKLNEKLLECITGELATLEFC